MSKSCMRLLSWIVIAVVVGAGSGSCWAVSAHDQAYYETRTAALVYTNEKQVVVQPEKG